MWTTSRLWTSRTRSVAPGHQGASGSAKAVRKAHTWSMAAVLVLVALLIVAGVAAWRGWVPDTRDPEYSLGRPLQPRGESTARPDNLHRPSPRSSADRAAAF